MNKTFKTFVLSAALVLAASCSTSNEEIVQKAKQETAKLDSAQKAQAVQATAKLKAKTP